MRQVVFRASGLLVRFAPQMVGAGLMTGGLAGTGFRDNPKLGDGNLFCRSAYNLSMPRILEIAPNRGRNKPPLPGEVSAKADGGVL